MANRDILETLFESWATHDALRAAACFSERGVYCEVDGREVVGREAIRAEFARFFRQGPPWRFDVGETIVQGDRAAVTFTFALKGDGGRWRERAGCAIVSFEQGLVAIWREYHG